VRLKLSIKNSSYHPASFRFEAQKAQREIKEKSSNFLWQGPTTRNVVALAPSAQCELFLDACMMNYGVYDLNRFSFAFFRDPATGDDLDPSGGLPQNVALKVYNIEPEQIFVEVCSRVS
jgi:hypothetical protein